MRIVAGIESSLGSGVCLRCLWPSLIRSEKAVWFEKASQNFHYGRYIYPAFDVAKIHSPEPPVT